MIKSWHDSRQVIKFQLGEITLGSKLLNLRACEVGVGLSAKDMVDVVPQEILLGFDGYLIRGMPCEKAQKKFIITKPYIVYTPTQYKRYYVDLKGEYEDYLNKFRTKTRSSIKRKIKKFEKYCDGTLDFRVYQTPEEIRVFFDIARKVSSKTYQEKLLNTGLPNTDSFLKGMCEAADKNDVRGYLLFHNGKPVSYLYLSASNYTLTYNYLGYDPDYMKWSVGTVLLWHAMESLFKENRFKFLDFMEGEGQQKRTFGNQNITCIDTYYLKITLSHFVYVFLHITINNISTMFGNVLDRMGAKSKIKRLLRFSR